MELPEEPADFSPEDSLDEEAILDRTPLKFGKYKGLTPEKLAETGGFDNKGSSWLRWAYENVFNFDVCSAALYRDCGGRGSRAVDSKKQAPVARPATYDRPAHSTGGRDVYSQNNAKPENRRFDEFDDDIPF